jgi:hypothetical protein
MSFPDELAAIDAERRLHALSRHAALEILAANPPAWLVDRILSTADYAVLAGAKGAGKTWAICDLAASVALGEPWLAHFDVSPARVLLLSAEDGMARLWRRLDAVARARGRDPAELEGRLYVHPASFDAASGLHLLENEIDELRPGLVAVDPAYRYMPRVRAQLFDMGAVLDPLGEACTSRGACLVVGHHYNRRADAPREERLSGAGLLEWCRVLITLEATAGPEAVCTLEISGNSIASTVVRYVRRVEATSDGPAPELSYAVEILAAGNEARRAMFQTAAERVLAVLPADPAEGKTIREIGDEVAASGGPLKRSTIEKVLHRDLEGQVDSDGGRPARWWRAP